MLLSDLLDLPVAGADGVAMGHVVDVRLALDGPPDGALAAPHLVGLVVRSRPRRGVLGDERVHTWVPWPLGSWLRVRHGAAFLVRWADVVAVDGGAVRLAPGAARWSAALPPRPGDAPRA